MLGIGYCAQLRKHIRVDFLYDNLSLKNQSLVDGAGYLFLLIPASAWLTWGLFEYWIEAYKVNERTGESAWNPLVWPFKFFFTFGFYLFTLQIIAECQKAGGSAAFIDAEHALDPEYAKALGVDIDELLLSQPDTGEQALEVTDMLVKSGSLDVIVVDSVAALVPRAELEGDMGDSHVGLQARLMSQALRKITGSIQKSNTLVIFINQIRMKIGVMFGSPETTTGGNALKFYSSVRLDIRRIGAIKDGDEVIGNETRVKVVKNKMAPPFKVVEFQILYGKGINKNAEIIEFAVKKGIIEKAGAWYSYKGDKIGQGIAKTSEFLKENPKVLEEIEASVLAD